MSGPGCASVVPLRRHLPASLPAFLPSRGCGAARSAEARLPVATTRRRFAAWAAAAAARSRSRRLLPPRTPRGRARAIGVGVAWLARPSRAGPRPGVLSFPFGRSPEQAGIPGPGPAPTPRQTIGSGRLARASRRTGTRAGSPTSFWAGFFIHFPAPRPQLEPKGFFLSRASQSIAGDLL